MNCIFRSIFTWKTSILPSTDPVLASFSFVLMVIAAEPLRGLSQSSPRSSRTLGSEGGDKGPPLLPSSICNGLGMCRHRQLAAYSVLFCISAFVTKAAQSCPAGWTPHYAVGFGLWDWALPLLAGVSGRVPAGSSQS